MSASGDLARSVADAHARKTLAALQIVGGVTFPTREHRCTLCADTGVILGDHDEFLDFCDCATGEAQR